MLKTELRKLYKEKRAKLPAADFALLNADILDQFAEVSLEGLQYLHLFLPIQQQREVNTYFIADWLRADHPKIQLVIARTDFERGTMETVLWEKNMPLEANAYGIPEPKGGTVIEPSLIDLVLVPLLAFDQQGHRVGYGRGFYDRFLAQCRPDCRKVGLSLFGPVESIADTAGSDVRLDACICPDQVYFFAR